MALRVLFQRQRQQSKTIWAAVFRQITTEAPNSETLGVSLEKPTNKPFQVSLRMDDGWTRFPVSVNQTLHEFMLDVNHELQMNRSQTHNEKPKIYSPQGEELDYSLHMRDVLKQNFRISLGGKSLLYDRHVYEAFLAENQKQIAQLECDIQLLEEKKVVSDRRIRLYSALLHGGTGAFLVSQLGIIVYLTYGELGWDFMEPATYLLGLSFSAFVLFVHNKTGKDFSFEHHFQNHVERVRKSYNRRLNLDPEQLAKAVSQLQALRTVFDPPAPSHKLFGSFQ